MENNEKLSINTMELGVYSIYDGVLKQFLPPFCVQKSALNDYMKLLVNDVQSKFFGHESDYILNEIGSFNQDNAELETCFIKRISVLDSYIDNNKRKLQTIIQTLNYLPQGYFKMPAEMKQDIQTNIDNCITKYVEDYVIPDMDINKEKDKLYNERFIDFVKKMRQFTEETHWEIPDATAGAMDDIIDEYFDMFKKTQNKTSAISSI